VIRLLEIDLSPRTRQQGEPTPRILSTSIRVTGIKATACSTAVRPRSSDAGAGATRDQTPASLSHRLLAESRHLPAAVVGGPKEKAKKAEAELGL